MFMIISMEGKYYIANFDSPREEWMRLQKIEVKK